MTEEHDENEEQITELPDEPEDPALSAASARIEAEIRERRAIANAVPRAEVLDLEAMLARYAYLKNEDRVVDLRKPHLTYSLQGFRNLTRSSTRTVIGARGGERQVPIADDWLAHDGRIDLEATTFRPNAPRVSRDLHGHAAVNMWTRPTIADAELPEDWEQRAAVFTTHLGYLIPDVTERNNVVRWIAQRFQKPEVLPSWHLLLVAENAHGTGRNWLARFLKGAMSSYVQEALPLRRILDGNFNAEVESAIIGIVDEIREGGNEYWKHAEALKSFLSEKTRVINKKYRAPYEVQNYLGVMMFSNHIDALPIDNADRRIYVARCTEEARDSAYFDYIYDAIKDPATIRALYELMLRTDLKGFSVEGRAPMTAAKQRMIEESRSDEEGELRAIIKEWPSDIIRSATLRQKLQEFRDNDLLFGQERHKSDQLSIGLLRRLYRTCGVIAAGQIRMTTADAPAGAKEVRYRILALRNYNAKWRGASDEALRLEVERGEAIEELRIKKEDGTHVKDGH
jgi:Family of unknown function (DUF5906)